MKDKAFNRWLIQTSHSYEEVSEIVRKTGFLPIDAYYRTLIGCLLSMNEINSLKDGQNLSLEKINQQVSSIKRLEHAFKNFLSLIEYFSKQKKSPLPEAYESEKELIYLNLKKISNLFENGKFSSAHFLKSEIVLKVLKIINVFVYEVFHQFQAKEIDEVASRTSLENLETLFNSELTSTKENDLQTCIIENYQQNKFDVEKTQTSVQNCLDSYSKIEASSLSFSYYFLKTQLDEWIEKYSHPLIKGNFDKRIYLQDAQTILLLKELMHFYGKEEGVI